MIEEHLREVRCLRQRLEESIRTNERLRQQLEQRLATTTRDGGTVALMPEKKEETEMFAHTPISYAKFNTSLTHQ